MRISKYYIPDKLRSQYGRFLTEFTFEDVTVWTYIKNNQLFVIPTLPDSLKNLTRLHFEEDIPLSVEQKIKLYQQQNKISANTLLLFIQQNYAEILREISQYRSAKNNSDPELAALENEVPSQKEMFDKGLNDVDRGLQAEASTKAELDDNYKADERELEQLEQQPAQQREQAQELRTFRMHEAIRRGEANTAQFGDSGFTLVSHNNLRRFNAASEQTPKTVTQTSSSTSSVPPAPKLPVPQRTAPVTSQPKPAPVASASNATVGTTNKQFNLLNHTKELKSFIEEKNGIGDEKLELIEQTGSPPKIKIDNIQTIEIYSDRFKLDKLLPDQAKTFKALELMIDMYIHTVEAAIKKGEPAERKIWVEAETEEAEKYMKNYIQNKYKGYTITEKPIVLERKTDVPELSSALSPTPTKN